MSKPPVKQHGFTIVELLIVIVVIGILAAIVIVAYSGITQRATVASMNSDLDNSSKQLKLYQVDNSAYPIAIDCSATPAANTICLKSSGGTTYTTFTPNNTTNPQTFCLTATNDTTNYYINQDGTPTSGGCSVTNLVTNPSFEVDTTGYSPNTGSPTVAVSNLEASAGAQSLYLTSTVVSPDVAPTFSITLAPGTYVLDYMVYSPAARTSVYFDYAVPSEAGGSQVGLQSIPANTWTRISGSLTISGTGPSSVAIYLHNAGGPNASGQVVFIDAIMLTQGPTLYKYADGSSSGWAWNGTANESTSTGLPL